MALTLVRVAMSYVLHPYRPRLLFDRGRMQFAPLMTGAAIIDWLLGGDARAGVGRCRPEAWATERMLGLGIGPLVRASLPQLVISAPILAVFSILGAPSTVASLLLHVLLSLAGVATALAALERIGMGDRRPAHLFRRDPDPALRTFSQSELLARSVVPLQPHDRRLD